MRTLAKEVTQYEGESVTLLGWVAGRRDHGKLVFVDLRDRSGVVQCVFNVGSSDNQNSGLSGNPPVSDIERLRSGWVIKVIGTVQKRPANMANPDLATGQYEIAIKELRVLNEAQTPPIAADGDGYEIGEESRLQYRYLDLRRPRLQNNLRRRHEVLQFIRGYLSERYFTEVETPIISKSTPEGARDYLVPARLHPGKFYALPQSPQQYKQLLMVAGLERYFQIARCFRDEDTRGDRQPEFTQLDLEMSFVDREEVMTLIEDLYVNIIERLFPAKKIQRQPFPRLTCAEAMVKHNTDRPDLRADANDANELAFVWVIDFPFFEKTDRGDWTFTHNPFSAARPEHAHWLIEKKNIGDISASQYDLVLNGSEIGGGSIRNHRPEALKAVLEIIGLDERNIQNNFGHLLAALSLGAPPHGGIAMGLDRLMAFLLGEPNIRETIAFPKTGDGRDLMMNAPAAVEKEQLDELHLQIKQQDR